MIKCSRAASLCFSFGAKTTRGPVVPTAYGVKTIKIPGNSRHRKAYASKAVLAGRRVLGIHLTRMARGT